MCFPPQPVAGITNCCKSHTITVALPWKPTCMHVTGVELLIKQRQVWLLALMQLLLAIFSHEATIFWFDRNTSCDLDTEKKTASGQLEHGFCHFSLPDSQAKMKSFHSNASVWTELFQIITLTSLDVYSNISKIHFPYFWQQSTYSLTFKIKGPSRSHVLINVCSRFFYKPEATFLYDCKSRLLLEWLPTGKPA